MYAKYAKLILKMVPFMQRGETKTDASMKRNRKKDMYEWCYYQQNDACIEAFCGNISGSI